MVVMTDHLLFVLDSSFNSMMANEMAALSKSNISITSLKKV